MIGLCLAGLAAGSPGAHGQQDSITYAMLRCGYEALPSNPAEAAHCFEEALRRNPSDRNVQMQLGSVYLAMERPAEAIRRFEIAHLIRPSDTTALQVAYLALRLGEDMRAYKIFQSLQNSSDPQIAATARQAVTVMEAMLCERYASWWIRPYATAYYDSRLEDLIFYGWLYGGYWLNREHSLSAYGVASIFKDTRSSGGALPVIFSDNYFLLGGGVRYLPLRGMTIDVQPGVTFDLLERPGKPLVAFDFRSTLSYGGGLYAPAEVAPRPSFPFHFFLDGYASLGYYSRYENVLLYSHGRTGVRAFTVNQTALDAYVRLNFVADTKGDYYNNILEAGAGLRFIPDHRWGVTLLVEYDRGRYLKSVPPSSVLDSPYDAFRLFLFYDRLFCP
jgi:tetratricopeptide (TPR) repeat protein